MVDEISPLIDIIFMVLQDIFWFMFVLLAVMYVLSMCFYLVAQNQIDFDIYTDEFMPDSEQ